MAIGVEYCVIICFTGRLFFHTFRADYTHKDSPEKAFTNYSVFHKNRQYSHVSRLFWGVWPRDTGLRHPMRVLLYVRGVKNWIQAFGQKCYLARSSLMSGRVDSVQTVRAKNLAAVKVEPVQALIVIL